MLDFTEIQVFPSTSSLLLAFAITPEDIELAFATNGESLRLKALMALMAELVIAPVIESGDTLAQYIPWSSDISLD